MIEGQDAPGRTARLRYGMAGGGPGAFIGDVQRRAIAMDGRATLVAGCFSRSFENTLAAGAALGLSRERLYTTPAEMIDAESRRADGIQFLVIVTPNDAHFEIAKRAIEAGIPVVCEKPLATSSRQAEELARLAAARRLLFCVTYAYAAYPLVKHARALVASGELGTVRFVSAEYPQEWLATPLETTGQKQAAWRTDPARAGISNCVGDIGSHIEHMVSTTTGLRIESLLARLDRFGAGRVLDDNASIMVDYEGGAKGLFWCSQIAVGHDNGLRVRVYGTKGSFEFAQETPNVLRVSFLDRPSATISRGRDPMAPRAQALSRIPSGHPEGYFECFANIYATFITALAKTLAGEPLSPDDLDFPSAEDGVRGVRFIEACVESSKKGAVWIKL
jgi:predicted dehydrogenase